jgi:hypothetical protein
MKKTLHVRVSILLTIGERESSGGPNVILCSPVFNASTEASDGVQRPLGHDRSARR